MFHEGVFELERQLRPDVIFIYGEKIDLQTRALQIWHPNKHITRLKRIKVATMGKLEITAMPPGQDIRCQREERCLMGEG